MFIFLIMAESIITLDIYIQDRIKNPSPGYLLDKCHETFYYHNDIGKFLM